MSEITCDSCTFYQAAPDPVLPVATCPACYGSNRTCTCSKRERQCHAYPGGACYPVEPTRPACHLYQGPAGPDLVTRLAVVEAAVDALVEDSVKRDHRVEQLEHEAGIGESEAPCPGAWVEGHPGCKRCEVAGSGAECDLERDAHCARCGRTSVCRAEGIGLCCTCCHTVHKPGVFPDQVGVSLGFRNEDDTDQADCVRNYAHKTGGPARCRR